MDFLVERPIYKRDGDAMTEQQLRAWLKKHWPGWMEWREPGKGQGIGAPDAQLLVGGFLVPVELKKLVPGPLGCVRADVRPAQIAWHFNYWRAGGVSLFLVACSDGVVSIITGDEARALNEGEPFGARLAEASSLERTIKEMVCEHHTLALTICCADGRDGYGKGL